MQIHTLISPRAGSPRGAGLFPGKSWKFSAQQREFPPCASAADTPRPPCTTLPDAGRSGAQIWTTNFLMQKHIRCIKERKKERKRFSKTFELQQKSSYRAPSAQRPSSWWWTWRTEWRWSRNYFGHRREGFQEEWGKVSKTQCLAESCSVWELDSSLCWQQSEAHSRKWDLQWGIVGRQSKVQVRNNDVYATDLYIFALKYKFKSKRNVSHILESVNNYLWDNNAIKNCQCDNKNNATTNLLHDLRVILLDYSVKQEAGHFHIYPRTFVAGAEVIWMTVKKQIRAFFKYRTVRHMKTQNWVKKKNTMVSWNWFSYSAQYCI